MELVWKSISGTENENLGFLDYLLVVPALVKLAFHKSETLQTLLVDFPDAPNFLVTIKEFLAFFITLALIPFSYLLYKCMGLKRNQLRKTYLEISILPVDTEKLAEMNLSGSQKAFGM